MTGPGDETLRAYERRADVYVAHSASGVSAGVAALLDAVVARVPRASRVLEVGSGPGLDASYLEGRGLRVDRTDASAAFVERLGWKGHRARLLDVRDGHLGGPYDAVLANAVLLHLDRPEVVSALQTCRAATRPGGLLALTLKEGDGEACSEAKLGLRRWFVFWREDALRDVLGRTGWDVVEVRHVQGRAEPWLHLLCERPGDREQRPAIVPPP